MTTTAKKKPKYAAVSLTTIALSVGAYLLFPTEDSLSVCSFNIQFLGLSRTRNDEALAELVSRFDVVVVQELVAPPYAGTFPDGTPYKPDPEAREFFEAMRRHGFRFVLSEEDTGTRDKIHNNGSATEWWVTFYKPERVTVVSDLPHGFLAEDRSNNPDYERVPYAVALRAGNLDFVLISVHLKPGSSGSARRAHELQAIAQWIDAHDEVEHDFIVLGDMNIQDTDELAEVTPNSFVSLNAACIPTNTNPRSPRPYDHVLVNPRHTPEAVDFQVVDLVGAIKTDRYDHNWFRFTFSDHNPVTFRLITSSPDDD